MIAILPLEKFRGDTIHVSPFHFLLLWHCKCKAQHLSEGKRKYSPIFGISEQFCSRHARVVQWPDLHHHGVENVGSIPDPLDFLFAVSNFHEPKPEHMSKRGMMGLRLVDDK